MEWKQISPGELLKGKENKMEKALSLRMDDFEIAKNLNMPLETAQELGIKGEMTVREVLKIRLVDQYRINLLNSIKGLDASDFVEAIFPCIEDMFYHACEKDDKWKEFPGKMQWRWRVKECNNTELVIEIKAKNKPKRICEIEIAVAECLREILCDRPEALKVLNQIMPEK